MGPAESGGYQPLHLAPHRRHDIEDQSGECAQETDDDQSYGEDRRRQPGRQPGFEIGLRKRNRERNGTRIRAAPTRPKNFNGRSLRTRSKMSLRILVPSRMVLSLLIDPEGRSP
jgi:hypothetical protein